MSAENASTAGRALGAAIRSAREDAGHTPDALAARAGVDPIAYEAVERGEAEPTLDMIVQIATALGLSGSELFERARL